MERTPATYRTALSLIDAAHSEDPNRVYVDGRDWPSELLYSERMSDMLCRYAPEADDAMRLAIRAQHIERWKSPRSDYPKGRDGYLKWRRELYGIQASTAARLLRQAGYGDDMIDRVKNSVAKKKIRSNPDSRLLEDVTALVFMEHYLLEFVGSHPDYSQEKLLGIIRKTWKKMSGNAQDFVGSGGISLPESLQQLIDSAIAGENPNADQ